MAQTPLLETQHTAEFLVSYATGHRSFDRATLIAGQNLQAGAVLGKITTSGKLTSYLPGAADGSQVVYGILYANTNAVVDTKMTIVARAAEVNLSELKWDASLNGAAIIVGTAGLTAISIIAR
jgi:hypothetical protein